MKGKKTGIEVSLAVAEAAKLARVEVISAYPITPQTHIVEHLAELVADGELEAVYLNVESEHSALSACVGAAAAGARTFTSTSAQGLELMHEILFIASSLRLPIVMVLVNRALSAPLSIWCDHSDIMAARDCGWIMLFCENGQEAVDSVLMAYRIAEDKSVLLPVMVNIDGFTLSHVIEPIEFPEQEDVDNFLPPYQPIFTLNPEKPVTMGAYGMPEIYTEAKYAQEMAILNSKKVIKEVMEEFSKKFKRSYKPVETYNLEGAKTAFLALGSINENIKTAIDRMKKNGLNVGLIALRLYRPFPSEELLEALKNVERLMVVERAMPQGATNGPLFSELSAFAFHNGLNLTMENYIAGLGGRDVDPQELVNIAMNPFKKSGEINYRVVGVRE